MKPKKDVPAGEQDSAHAENPPQVNRAQVHDGNTEAAGAVQTTSNDGDRREKTEYRFEVVVEPIGEVAGGKLRECEEIIGRNLLSAFVVTGKALKIIRDEELYKDSPFWTFDEYVRQRWMIERTYAHRLIRAAEVYENLLSIGNTDGDVPLPTNEAQVRPLARLDPAKQKAAWKRAVRSSGQNVPTASEVARVVRVIAPPKPKKNEAAELPIGAEDTSNLSTADAGLNRSQAARESINPIRESDAITAQGLALPPVLTAVGNPPLPKVANGTPAAPEPTETDAATALNKARPVKGDDLVRADEDGSEPNVANVVSSDNMKTPLIPPEQIELADAAVKYSDLSGTNGGSLTAAVRHFIPLVAELLNRSAEQFPEMTGRDLTNALNMAKAKLQVAMKWL